jgi:hypothetical protein
MQKLKQVISSHQSDLRSHVLFELLESTRSVETISRVARAIAWWPMVFQDVLRLNLQFIRGSGFEHFAEHHRKEDAGHDDWFLHDLGALKVEELTLDALFANEFQPIRDACYSLINEVHSEQPAVQRLAFVRALEPTGHVFFEEIVNAAERLCPEVHLRYFSRSHLDVEQAHDLFSCSTDADLDKIVLTDEERAKCEASVARVFQTFTDMFTYLDERATNAPRGNRSHIRELAGGTVEPLNVERLRNVRSG